MLDFPREVVVTDLTLGHFLYASKAIVDKANAIKELSSRAEVLLLFFAVLIPYCNCIQGEVMIRKAIQELKVWASDTSFTLIDHVENNRSTPLIKEWRGKAITAIVLF